MSTKNSLPARKIWAPTFFKILAVIFLGEAAVMLFLQVCGLRGPIDIILDPVLLGLITTPLLYRFAIKPLTQAFQRRRRIDDMLQFTIEGTSNALGDDFFRSLTQHLATALDVRYAIIGELVKPQCKSIRTLGRRAHAGFFHERPRPVATPITLGSSATAGRGRTRQPTADSSVAEESGRSGRCCREWTTGGRVRTIG